ncbi:MAG: hypothetical protein EPN93_09565 [Spirochaetes bacterium]|nr:MAG: hypothetical protein EPN93_09565 [Spirochaetota bacterium]
MKIKFAFASVLAMLLLLTGAQMFSIPPYAGDIHEIYRSGYFVEIERGFGVIRDSFIGTKMMAKDPAYAWMLLQDIGESQGTDIAVYTTSAYRVTAPGKIESSQDPEVVRLLNSVEPRPQCRAGQRRYSCLIPVRFEEKCRFCHESARKKPIAGVMRFERDYDATVYYRAERMVLFGVLSAIFALLLYYVLKWEPGRGVKELFDK